MKSCIWIVCAMLLVLSGAAPASAQLFEFTSAADATLWTQPGDTAGYDPVHDLYFVADSWPSVIGRFINRSGVTIATVSLDARSGVNPRVAYSPDVSDGSGGRGGFIVVWEESGFLTTPGLVGQIVAFPAGLVGSKTTVVPDGFTMQIGVAYSPIDHVFLVGIAQLSPPGPSYLGESARIVRLDLNARPIDGIALSTSPSYACGNSLEFPFSCNTIDAAYNPASGEFGVVYSQGKQKVLARVSGGGVVISRTPLGIGAYYGALAVNLATGSYIVTGTEGGSVTDRAEVSADGSVIAQDILTSSLDTQEATLALTNLSYSATSGTFLLSGRTAGPLGLLRLMELDAHGSFAGSELTIPNDTWGPIAAHASAAEWLVTARGATYVIRSSTRTGLSSCATPDPFAVLGGGTCFNSGWLPPGMLPPPVITACQTPDPFAALGGGYCVNGGWFPPHDPVLTPAPPSLPSPPPSTDGCITPDPFVAMGGGRCVNGGWIPPDMVIPPPPATCTTPDPFVAIGGGVCVDGGWRPRG